MLAQYTQYRADSFVAQPQVCTSSDLSYVHSYLSPKHWLKIHKRICKSDDKKLIYSWVRMSSGFLFFFYLFFFFY